MTTTILNIDLIVSNPAVRKGQPVIDGTQVRVLDIVASHLYRGFTPDELAVQFNLSLAQVYAALAYYYSHTDELNQTMREEAETAEHLLSNFEKQGKLIRF